MTFTPAYYEWHLLDDNDTLIFHLDDPEWVKDCKTEADVEHELNCIVDYLFMEEYDNEDYNRFLYGISDEERDHAVELMATTLYNYYLN